MLEICSVGTDPSFVRLAAARSSQGQGPDDHQPSEASLDLDAGDVVLIEDDRLFTEILSFHLGSLGYRVHASASAAGGIALARRLKPDVVIADISLGKSAEGGLDAAMAIHREHGTPIVFVTVDPLRARPFPQAPVVDKAHLNAALLRAAIQQACDLWIL